MGLRSSHWDDEGLEGLKAIVRRNPQGLTSSCGLGPYKPYTPYKSYTIDCSA